MRKRTLACSPKFLALNGAISFIQSFSSTLNLHPHFHLVVTDGIFEIGSRPFKIHEALIIPSDLKPCACRNWIEKDGIEKMLIYENSGF
ncbi:MAG: transposase [Parachlamydia sp.]|nr:transposase [Parachlamydia sp.]